MALKLSIVVDSSGQLRVVPTGARRPVTSLTFRPDGVDVAVADCSPVLLAWDDYGEVDHVMDTTPRRAGWVLTFWTSGRAGVFGVAVGVSGTYAEQTSAISAKTSTVWRRLNRFGGPSLAGRSLPVLPGTTIATRCTRELATLGALCSVLSDDPLLRQRLQDITRMSQLACDVLADMLSLPSNRTGIGREATDIHVAMKQAGLIHRYGRPLTTVGMPTPEEAVEQVVATLRSNPYRDGREVDRDQVERVVRRDFLDVDPWPFSALVA